jgi:thiamine-phosphate pyrophosphorylase
MQNKLMHVLPGIYAITDCANLCDDELLIKTKIILKAGVSLLQYRNKTQNQQQKKELALKLQSLCHQYNTPFIINDDVELAKDITADGIHLGRDDEDIAKAREILGNKIIGISCYNDLNRALSAEKAGADYVAFGSIFLSVTKPGAIQASLELVQQARSTLSIPIVAIGGITPENAKPLIEIKVDYLAVINGLYSSTDTSNSIQSYNKLFNQ